MGTLPWYARTLVAVILLACATPAVAQVRGTVTDPHGEPLRDVSVEAWNGRVSLGAVASDSTGRFSFSLAQSASARRLILKRLGYRAVGVDLSTPDTVLQLRMEPLPVELPELRALAPGDPCPNREEPEARRLWMAAQDRYDTTSARRGMAARLLRTRETVVPDRVGLVDETRQVPADWRHRAGWWPEAHAPYGEVNAVIARHGYALRIGPERPGVPGEDYFGWIYPALEAGHAHHFVSAEFAGRHSLSIASATDDGYVITFCPLEKRRPRIEGTLVIGRDTTLLSASWSFRTPKPREEAGGEVIFLPWRDSPGGPPHLLAARGAYWRRLGGRTLFYQRSEVFLGWEVAAGTEMPDLPVPPSGGEGGPHGGS